jgi:hypothetical protein
MAHDSHDLPETPCPSCDFGPFTRNAYWTGKLMLAADFIAEQRYVIEKLRHHEQHLHGWGVVCGLKVVAHDNPACQDRFVCVEPGTAVDCCGQDIILRDKDCIDLFAIPALKALKDANDVNPHRLQICIRFRECENEQIPVLYDECGCDDNKCAPNRILESYELNVLVDPKTAPAPAAFPAQCGDLWNAPLDACPRCDQADCIVLATINGYVVGNKIVDMPVPLPTPMPDGAIDNLTDRHILPSVAAIKSLIDCILKSGSGGGAGQPGKDGADGVGLEAGLTQISALSWKHNVKEAQPLLNITMQDQSQRLGLVIGFTGPVQVKLIDAAHVFQVLTEHDVELNTRQGLICRCPIAGDVIAVKVDQSSGLVTSAQQINDQFANAVAFLLPKELLGRDLNKYLEDKPEFWVMLRCDFVLDKAGKAVDGEFVRAQLPTGDRPAGANVGIQGGLFESWFSVK